jgi:hypothetical protein
MIDVFEGEPVPVDVMQKGTVRERLSSPRRSTYYLCSSTLCLGLPATTCR